MTGGSSGPAAAEALERFLRALLDGDRRAAFAVLDDALAAGLDLSAVYLEVLQPALREIGRLWEENAISVADEHLATAITEAAMARVFERVYAWQEATRPTLIAACADTERHQVGLRMLCDLLEARGWRTHYLGATVPVDDLVRMVRLRRPAVVALSAALAPHVPRIRAMITALREQLGDAVPLIIVGGRPFVADQALADAVGADHTARDAAEAVRLLEAYAAGARVTGE